MRRAARKDENHKEISKTFSKLGWSVLDISNLKNCADLVVGKRKHTIIIEIKNGSNPPSRQKLTTGEESFHAKWNGDIRIVNCIQDVIDLDRELNKKPCNTAQA